jgi:hypothetical protein
VTTSGPHPPRKVYNSIQKKFPKGLSLYTFVATKGHKTS